MTRACPLFVPLVEEGMIDHAGDAQVAAEYLAPLRADGVDTLILGCTHYPLLKRVIGETVGDDVVLVDSAVETAIEVEHVLSRHGVAGASGGDFHIILSDTSPAFEDLAERCLGRRVREIELVSVG